MSLYKYIRANKENDVEPDIAEFYTEYKPDSQSRKAIAKEEVIDAAKNLLDFVAEKYKVDRKEDLYRPHMRKLAEAIDWSR